MTSELTLTIEQSTLESATKYAQKQQKSLSDLVENYLRGMVKEAILEEKPHAPITKSLKGAFRVDADFDYKEENIKRLTKKYL